MTAPSGLAAIRAGLTAHSDALVDALAAALAYLGSKPEWSTDDNFETTEWVASLAARCGLPSAGDQTPAALAFYRAAAREAGYDVDTDEGNDDARP